MINQTWNLQDPVVIEILEENDIGYGWNTSYWNQNSINLIVRLPYYISFKSNTGINGKQFYRNDNAAAGILLSGKDYLGNPTTPAITNQTVSFQVQGPDIFQVPSNTFIAAVWIDGERIEYQTKTQISSDVWEFGRLIRGTSGTSPANHTADSTINIYAELAQNMPSNSDIDIWNLANPTVDDIAALGGLWWAETPQAIFLKQGPGEAVP